MHIISYDVAAKSLAISILEFNENWRSETLSLLKSLDWSDVNGSIDILKSVSKLIDNIIKPLYFDVADLIPKKKLKDSNCVDRAKRLKGYLQTVDVVINSLNINKATVLIEYQMGPNDKSRNIGSQILYHYSNPDINFLSFNLSSDIPILNDILYDVHIVGPSLKNQICLIKGFELSFFIQKYVRNYDANKAHSKTNFIKWLENKNYTSMLKNIKKKYYDDIADSFMQACAWFIKHI